jgi:SAM-dependent methyltransferase
VTTDLRAAYEAAGAGWGGGPTRVYAALAGPLLDEVGEVGGRQLLDVGSGAGHVARALVARGAQVVGCDLAHSMLLAEAALRPAGVVGDVLSLPFSAAAFDGATAAFLFNHLEAPEHGLAELLRVCRPGAVLLATTFEGMPTHPVKQAVETAATLFGYVQPRWYGEVRRVGVSVSSAPVLRDAALQAGWSEVTVTRCDVRPEGLSPGDLVAWRLGMAHLTGFVAGLSVTDRRGLVADAVARVAQCPPLVLPVLMLRAVRPCS